MVSFLLCHHMLIIWEGQDCVFVSCQIDPCCLCRCYVEQVCQFLKQDFYVRFLFVLNNSLSFFQFLFSFDFHFFLPLSNFLFMFTSFFLIWQSDFLFLVNFYPFINSLSFILIFKSISSLVLVELCVFFVSTFLKLCTFSLHLFYIHIFLLDYSLHFFLRLISLLYLSTQFFQHSFSLNWL